MLGRYVAEWRRSEGVATISLCERRLLLSFYGLDRFCLYFCVCLCWSFLGGGCGHRFPAFVVVVLRERGFPAWPFCVCRFVVPPSPPRTIVGRLSCPSNMFLLCFFCFLLRRNAVPGCHSKLCCQLCHRCPRGYCMFRACDAPLGRLTYPSRRPCSPSTWG